MLRWLLADISQFECLRKGSFVQFEKQSVENLKVMNFWNDEIYLSLVRIIDTSVGFEIHGWRKV